MKIQSNKENVSVFSPSKDKLDRECKFKPQINQKSVQILEQNRRSLERDKVFDVLYADNAELIQKKTEKAQEALRKKEEQELKAVTFKPKINKEENLTKSSST